MASSLEFCKRDEFDSPILEDGWPKMPDSQESPYPVIKEDTLNVTRVKSHSLTKVCWALWIAKISIADRWNRQMV